MIHSMAAQIELDTVKWITDYGNLERSKIKGMF